MVHPVPERLVTRKRVITEVQKVYSHTDDHAMEAAEGSDDQWVVMSDEVTSMSVELTGELGDGDEE